MVRRALPLLLLASVAISASLPASGDGRVLDGRRAPDFAFPNGLGVAPGTRLSSFRGDVVWIKFVLRDCPLCRHDLPRAQDLHERWGGSGLKVLMVMHEHPPAAFRQAHEADGYTFAVGCDPEGEMALKYGVGRRPTDYVVDADGRVRRSNGAPDRVLRAALARRRVDRLGEVPAGWESVRDAVWRWDYGRALRDAEPRLESETISGPARELARRVRADAARELDARLAYVKLLVDRRENAAARRVAELLADHFEGTSLEEEARAALDAL